MPEKIHLGRTLPPKYLLYLIFYSIFGTCSNYGYKFHGAEYSPVLFRSGVESGGFPGQRKNWDNDNKEEEKLYCCTVFMQSIIYIKILQHKQCDICV